LKELILGERDIEAQWKHNTTLVKISLARIHCNTCQCLYLMLETISQKSYIEHELKVKTNVKKDKWGHNDKLSS
jgi:hypothetical protein